MAARHLVARQVVEVVAASRAEAEHYARRVSAAKPRLDALLERLLDAHDRPGERLRLDRVEIDVGGCDPAHWEAALLAGIERGLGLRLAAAVEAVAGPSVPPPVPGPLLLLGEFARSGRLPWWGGPGDTPAGAVAALAQSGAEPASIRRLLALPGAIDRLVFQLDDEALAKLAMLAGTTNAAAVMPAGEMTGQAADQAGQVGQNARSRADRLARWQEILRAAAAMPFASAQPGESPAEPAVRFDAAPARSASPPASSPANAERLPTEQPPGVAGAPLLKASHPAAGAVSGGPDPAAGDGALPDLPAGAARGGSVSNAHAERTAGSHAPAFTDPTARLRAIAAARPIWEALAREAARLARGLDTDGGEALAAAMAGASDDGEALRTAVAALADLGAIDRDQATRWRDAIDRSRAATQPRAVVPDDPHDSLAVDSAGLPLVWPFLPAFFESLGLVVDGGFADMAARHRAATLLFHLATGERVADETRLALPKAFTGIDLDAVHDPGEPLSDVEVAASGALLTALLGHAPMLGKLSIEGLRASYLVRPGSLTARDGHFLLRVERRGFDLLLDRLPWGFGWVRLPWMAAPMQVEW